MQRRRSSISEIAISITYIHPPRYPPASDGPGKVVLISNSGYPERHHFSGMEETFRRWTDSPDRELTGMICCAGGALLQGKALQEAAIWYIDAARRAVREVIDHGRISPETQEILDRPLIEDPAVYVDIVNAFWKSQGVELFDPTGSTTEPKAAGHTTAAPLPPPQSIDTMRDLVAGMAIAFDPEAAGDLEAVIQFQVPGDHPESYYLDIARGRCAAFEGEHPSPSLIIHTPADVWMAIGRGEMNGAMAMMASKYTVKGNLGLLMRLGKLFSSEGQV